MTTEDDFQAALDAAPDDWQTRLVFADWLDERGDPRAEGYRAMGALRLYADMDYHLRFVFQSRGEWIADGSSDRSVLPPDWYEPLHTAPTGGEPDLQLISNEPRRSAEDKVALAFARLPAQRKAALLGSAPE